MDILNAMSRWLGSKRSEMHHCFDSWKQIIPQEEKEKLRKNLIPKALSMTGIGFGLSPTNPHPEGGVGFFKYITKTGVSSDPMVNHTDRHSKALGEEIHYHHQSNNPLVGPQQSGYPDFRQEMPNNTYNLQYTQQLPPRPQLMQQRLANPIKNFFLPGGIRCTAPTQQRGFQDCPAMSYVGQPLNQAQVVDPRPKTMWTDAKSAPAPQTGVNASGGVHHNTTQWSNVYPHSMQLPTPQANQVAGPGSVPYFRPSYNVCPGPQYSPQNCYQAFYPEAGPPPQQQQVPWFPPPVGTPYVMCQSGSSPYMSIIPLQSIQMFIPTQIRTSPSKNQSHDSNSHASGADHSTHVKKEIFNTQSCQQQHLQSPPPPYKENKPTEENPSLEKTEAISTTLCQIPDSAPEDLNLSDQSVYHQYCEVDSGFTSTASSVVTSPDCESANAECAALLITPSVIENIVVVASSASPNCDNEDPEDKCSSQIPNKEAAFSTERTPSQKKNCRESHPERFMNRNIALTPGPKKRKSRPSAEKRRRRRTPTNTLLNKTESTPKRESKAESKSKKAKSTECPVVKCMSQSVAFVLGLDLDSDTVARSPTFIERVSFTISPSDSDSDLDNFFDDDSSESDKGEENNDFDFFDLCSDPHNPLNSHSSLLLAKEEPIKKSSSAPHLLYFATCQGQLFEDDIPPVKTSSKSSKKQVKFASDETLQTVHLLEEDDPEAAREARKTHWEFFALDRFRFMSRIVETEKAIGHIFSDEHRRNVSEKIKAYSE